MQRSRRVIHWIAPFARCWILNQIAKSVAVYHRDGSALVYGPGATIPLDAFGCSENLAVDEIFRPVHLYDTIRIQARSVTTGEGT